MILILALPVAVAVAWVGLGLPWWIGLLLVCFWMWSLPGRGFWAKMDRCGQADGLWMRERPWGAWPKAEFLKRQPILLILLLCSLALHLWRGAMAPDFSSGNQRVVSVQVPLEDLSFSEVVEVLTGHREQHQEVGLEEAGLDDNSDGFETLEKTASGTREWSVREWSHNRPFRRGD